MSWCTNFPVLGFGPRFGWLQSFTEVAKVLPVAFHAPINVLPTVSNRLSTSKQDTVSV